jgi:hypothetical protein
MKKALLIGINYIDISGISLKGCINDIINVRNMLIDAYQYDINNIILLRDDDNIKYLQPTHSNIIEQLSILVEESKNLEELWFHYSGHGTQIQIQDCKLKEDVIVPIDYIEKGYILDNEIFDIIKEIKCIAHLIFDCCHSGTVCKLQFKTEYDIDMDTMTTIKINDSIIENPNIYMLSGCDDEETSNDTINELDQRMGAFTNAFTECLRKKHHTSDILTLYKDICIYLKENGYSQIPIFSCSQSYSL